MAKNHQVKKKETLTEIANREKISQEAIINANSQKYPDLYKNHSLLFEGMVLIIPDNVSKSTNQSSSAIGNYVTLGKRNQYLRLTLDDPNLIIVTNKITLEIDNVSKDIIVVETDGGRVKIIKTKQQLDDNISAIKSSSLNLTLKRPSGDEDLVEIPEKILLNIGDMDPLGDPQTTEGKIAVQKILANLGYYKVRETPSDKNSKLKIDGNLESEGSMSAIKRFQKDWMQGPPTGKPDLSTLGRLAYHQGTDMPHLHLNKSKDAQNDTNDRNSELLKSDYSHSNVMSTVIENFHQYDELTLHIPHAGKPGPKNVGNAWRIYPSEVFVAPCIEKPEIEHSNNPNHIRVPEEKFLFMDIGKWYKEGRYFGVVWGRHVYLCHYGYVPNGRIYREIETIRKEGMDYDFFTEMSKQSAIPIYIIKFDVAHWGLDTDYEWDMVHIIISDMHLMSSTTGHIWFDKLEYRQIIDKDFNVDNGFDLLRLAVLLKLILPKGKAKIIQIGDSYDLWVGRGFATLENKVEYEHKLRFSEDKVSPFKYMLSPLYRENEDEAFVLGDNYSMYELDPSYDKPKYVAPGSKTEHFMLVNNFVDKLVHFIRDIEGRAFANPWVEKINTYHNTFIADIRDKLKEIAKDDYEPFCTGLSEDNKTVVINPAISALNLLQAYYGKDMIFIYGNHDNYLIHPELCQRANLEKRVAYHQQKSLYIEHAHRLEAAFTEGVVGGIAYKFVPRNNDGVWSGFKATNEAFYARTNPRLGFNDPLMVAGDNNADNFAELHDQPIYIDKFAKLMKGRMSTQEKIPPHIFIIGHTHMPRLDCVSIKEPVRRRHRHYGKDI